MPKGGAIKLIIAGGRDYRFSVGDFAHLEKLHRQHTVTEVVSGEATGADWYGKYWAYERQIPVKGFPADWNDLSKPDAIIKTRRDGTKYDAYAGPRRNREMAAYADAVALFPGGSGTQDMYRAAKEAGIEIFDFRKGKE